MALGILAIYGALSLSLSLSFSLSLSVSLVLSLSLSLNLFAGGARHPGDIRCVRGYYIIIYTAVL